MKSISEIKQQKRVRRHAKVRTRVIGTPERPRLAVFKSNRYIYAQIIDDTAGKTLASASSIKTKKGTLKENAERVGVEIAKAAQDKKVTKVVFDRGGFIYAGHIQVFADSARKAGLIF